MTLFGLAEELNVEEEEGITGLDRICDGEKDLAGGRVLQPGKDICSALIVKSRKPKNNTT
jgi:hypothetical protein